MTGSRSVTPKDMGATTPLHITDDGASSVQVAIRVRPMLPSEAGSTQCIEVLSSESRQRNVVRIGGDSGPTFAFDEAFPGTSSQRSVFETRVVPLVRKCLEGYNATVLAYGQTGSGKTHTMMGPATKLNTAMQDETTAGIIPRALRSLFDELEQKRQQLSSEKENRPEENNRKPYEYEVRVQFLEVYGEAIRDLLSPQQASSERLTIRDVGLDEPEVLGATQHKVETAEEALLCLTRGMLRRVTARTAMNASSSRSHAILSVLVEQTLVLDSGSDNNGTSQQQVQHVEVKRSKFNFVDLAGSERQKRTHASGKRLKEGIDINKGLLVLGNVISALGDPKKRGKTFVPYRDSKLTRLLKGSLGGNHKTLMVACVSPSSSNLEESLNCLRYANRAKNIQNTAVVNVDAGSRLVVELRGHVQVLATELLRVRNGEEPSEETLTIEMLKSMAQGADSLGSVPDGASNKVTPAKTTSHWAKDGNKLAEDEFGRLKEKLRLAEVKLTTTSEELCAAKAERELYRIQSIKGEEGEDRDADHGAAFLEKARAYEEEIASLKESLAVSETVTAEDGTGSSLDAIEKANKVLVEEKAQLSSLQKALSRSVENSPSRTSRDYDNDTAPDSPELNALRAQALGSISLSDQLDAEEAASQAELSALTKQYAHGALSDEEGGSVSDEDAPTHDDGVVDEDETSVRRRRQWEAHLVELSNSIDAKQELIQQLQLSQQKYATMREFYEEKLRHMEQQMKERETERDELEQELKKLEESNPQKKDLEHLLEKKEKHIAGLRQKKIELLSLTKVSSENESQIVRLRNDVVSMKQKKVELQKQIAQERKHHTREIKRLRKEAMQKEREASKYKKMSDRNAIQAENAQRVAKSRLEEVGHLRTKYKEAEKKLRMQTLKKGVMKKAGLDQVIVGRRETRRNSTSKKSLKVDSIRDFLDARIAEVGRKEAIADKVAHEWEEHLELVSQREDLVSRQGASVQREDLDALDVQIHYKEGRIRQLAHRLGKQKHKAQGDDNTKQEMFLDERAFQSLCAGASELSTARVASRVLFGMVVREKRRVAALARTASSLDEKVVEAEERASAIDAAFLSYMAEERHQRASMTQNQQEQILSLMEMVQQENKGNNTENGIVPEDQHPLSFSAGRVDSRALVLANERISVLEQQLREMESEFESQEVYKSKEAEVSASLERKSAECDELQQEVDRLRATLRQIRDTVSRNDAECSGRSQEPGELGGETTPSSQSKNLVELVFDIVTDSLHPSVKESPAPKEQTVFRGSYLSNSHSQSHFQYLSSDSGDDGEVPEWAGDIMEDLALIAGGEIPPSLRNTPQAKEFDRNLQKEDGNGTRLRNGNVFDRLTDPESFTGVQKQKAPSKQQTRDVEVSHKDSNLGGQQQRVAASRSGSDDVNKIAPPEATSPSRVEREPMDSPNLQHAAVDIPGGGKNLSHEAEDQAILFSKRSEEKHDEAAYTSISDRRSVFDRLMSPSSYTGVQKAAVHERRVRVEDADTDKLLDELLDDDPDNGKGGGSRPSSKVEDYTQQNVFERLQRTTTQSYAVKQHAPAIRPHADQSSLVKAEIDKQPRAVAEDVVSSPSRESATYVHQNVFERLQKTTTQAYAGKKHSTLPRSFVDHESSVPEEEDVVRPNSRSNSTGRASPAGVGTNQDVFERLQRTTTQAYASKKTDSGKPSCEEPDRHPH